MDSGKALRDTDLSFDCDGLFGRAKDKKFSQMKPKNIAIKKGSNTFSIIVSSKMNSRFRRIHFSEITAYKLRSDAGLATPLLRLSTCNEEYMIKFDVDRDRANWMAHLEVAFAVVKKNFEWTAYFLYVIYPESGGHRDPFLLRLLPEEEPLELAVENTITREESQRFYLRQLLAYRDSAAGIVNLTYANSFTTAQSHECPKSTLNFKCSWSISLIAVLTKRLGRLGLQFRSDGGTEFRRVFPEQAQPVTSPGNSTVDFRRSIRLSSSSMSPPFIQPGNLAELSSQSQSSAISPVAPQQQWQHTTSEASPTPAFRPRTESTSTQQRRPDTLQTQHSAPPPASPALGQVGAPPPLPPSADDMDLPVDFSDDLPPPPDFLSLPSPLQTSSPCNTPEECSPDATTDRDKSRKALTLPKRGRRKTPIGNDNEYVPLSPTQPGRWDLGNHKTRIESTSSTGSSEGSEQTASSPLQSKVPYNTPVSSLPQGVTRKDMRLYMNVSGFNGSEELEDPPQAGRRRPPKPHRRQVSTDGSSRSDTNGDAPSEAEQAHTPVDVIPPKATPRSTLKRSQIHDGAGHFSGQTEASAGELEWLESDHPSEAVGPQAEALNCRPGMQPTAVSRLSAPATRHSPSSTSAAGAVQEEASSRGGSNGVLNWLEVDHPSAGGTCEENPYSHIDSFKEEQRPTHVHVRKTGSRFERAIGGATDSPMGYFESFDSDQDDSNTQCPDEGSESNNECANPQRDLRFDSLLIKNTEDDDDDGGLGGMLSGDLSGAVIHRNFFQRRTTDGAVYSPETASFLNPAEADAED